MLNLVKKRVWGAHAVDSRELWFLAAAELGRYVQIKKRENTLLVTISVHGARPHMVHVDQIPFEVDFMSSFMSSSTVKFLFLASSLTFNAVSFLIVRNTSPFLA